MKKKELKNLAEKIAKQEVIIQTSKDSAEIQAAQNEIMRLSSRVRDFQDIDTLDEMIQEYLKNMS